MPGAKETWSMSSSSFVADCPTSAHASFVQIQFGDGSSLSTQMPTRADNPWLWMQVPWIFARRHSLHRSRLWRRSKSTRSDAHLLQMLDLPLMTLYGGSRLGWKSGNSRRLIPVKLLCPVNCKFFFASTKILRHSTRQWRKCRTQAYLRSPIFFHPSRAGGFRGCTLEG